MAAARPITAEDLNGAADFLITTDHRVEFAVPGSGGEVSPIFFKGFVGVFWVLIGHGLAATYGLDGVVERVGVGADLTEQPLSAAAVLCKSQQQMLNGDLAVAIALCEAVGTIEKVAQALAQIHRFGRQTGSGF